MKEGEETYISILEENEKDRLFAFSCMNARLDRLNEAVEAENVESVKEWIDAYSDD